MRAGSVPGGMKICFVGLNQLLKFVHLFPGEPCLSKAAIEQGRREAGDQMRPCSLPVQDKAGEGGGRSSPPFPCLVVGGRPCCLPGSWLIRRASPWKPDSKSESYCNSRQPAGLRHCCASASSSEDRRKPFAQQ
eukprot:365277-Chlamydomonas_euryale.AAC.12